MKKILIGGFRHESNMFNPVLTDLEAFRIRDLLYGNDLIEKRRGTDTEIGGFLDILEKRDDIEVVPTVSGFAMPAGPVTEDVFEEMLGVICSRLDTGDIDAVLLALHGAMVGVEHHDGEGYVLERIRSRVGPDIPIVSTLDLHAVLTPLMIEMADALTVYRTYPHMDMSARGREAASILLSILAKEVCPVMALSKQPLLIGPPHNVLPTDMPMKMIMERARQMEKEIPGVIAACPAHGFMQQDVEFAGTGVVVTADRDMDLAQKCADELGDLIWEHRREYFVDLPDPAETIRLAMKSQAPPVAIADSGDNIGGGTPGDGTALLREILEQGVDSAFVPLWDPESARIAAEAGVGATVTLEVGGKSSEIYGPPVTVTGTVRTITDGVYLNRKGGGYNAGTYDNMGLSVRVDVGGITIVLNSISISPNNIMHANAIGVYPEDYRMSVCKGGLAFREAYKPPVVTSYIQSDTPGYSSSNLRQFTWENIQRPIFPLDDI